MGARGPRAHGGGPPAPEVAAGGAAWGCAGAAGTGPNSAVMRKMWPVLVSRVSVLARAGVGTVCSTVKLVGEFFLDDGEGAVALRTEGLHGFGVEGGAVAAVADGQVGDDVAVGGREDDHVVVFAAGGEEDVVLGVEREAGAACALA